MLAQAGVRIHAMDSKSVVQALNDPAVLRPLTKAMGHYQGTNPSVRGKF